MTKKFSVFSGNNTLKLIMQLNLFRIFIILSLIALNSNTVVLGIFSECCIQNYMRTDRFNLTAHTLVLFSLVCNILPHAVGVSAQKFKCV